MSKKVFLYMSSGLHNAYRNMVANVPEEFAFAESEFMGLGIVRASQPIASNLGVRAKRDVHGLEPFLSPYYNHAKILLNKPKVRKFHEDDYDLVHSGQSLLDTNLPYVVDFEHAAVFCGYNQYGLRRPGFVRALERILLDKKLKKLLAWSDAAAKSLTNVVNNKDEIAQKVETFYPVMAPARRVRRTNNSFNFLFIGKKIYEKGGYESLLAFEKFADRYDCHFTAIGDIPQEIYSRFGENRKITLLQRVPYEKIAEFYSNSDVFVFPTHYDTYGFVITEALSFGLPVISLNSFSTPELVQHERTGLLVKTFFSSYADDYGYATSTQQEFLRKLNEVCRKPPDWYVTLLSEAMERFLKDSRFKSECSKNAISETTEGKFSPKRSKQQLKRIYEQALSV
jgi:glycosyltransferase involved in cell wall biosynthesis